MKHDHFYDGFLARRLAERCDWIVCVSEAMAEQFPPAVRARTTIAYPGVWLSAPVQLRETEPLIVCVGRLDPAKGFYDLIRATRILRDRGVDARIRVAGPVDRIYPEHAGELERLVVDLGLQEHAEVGWVDDLDGALPALSRRRDGLAAGGARQAQRGRADGADGGDGAVAAGGGAARAGDDEVMGEVGTLVDRVDPEGLADALEPYLRDEALARAVGQQGRERAERLFSMEHTVETLEGIYRRLAGVTTPLQASTR